MIDEVPALVETRTIEVVHPPLVEPPAPAITVEAPTPEQIHLMDAAFVSNSDRQDSMVGMVGLTLMSPWIADVLADHFRVPPDEEHDVSLKDPPKRTETK